MKINRLTIASQVAMLEATCKGDATARSLWKEVQVLTNKTKELKLAISVEKMKSEEELFRCETR